MTWTVVVLYGTCFLSFGIRTKQILSQNYIKMDFVVVKVNHSKLYVAFIWIVVFISFSCTSSHDLVGLKIANVSCTYRGIQIPIIFSRVFKGAVFPKQNYFNPVCRFTAFSPGTKNVTIFFPLTDCGNLLKEVNSEIYITNTIVIQAHPVVETDADMVTNVMCKLPRSHSTRNPVRYVTPEFEAHMDFEMRGNRFGFDIAKKLLVGDEFTIVIHIKDRGKYEDMQVENCWASERQNMSMSRYVLQLYDKHKCGQDNWITEFSFTKNISETVINATMRAFKFPGIKNLHFTCTVQTCTKMCFRYCENYLEANSQILRRDKRSVLNDTADSSLSVRYRLMKNTIRALKSRLIEKNKIDLSENDTRFRKRVLNDGNTTTEYNDQTNYLTITPTTIRNDILYFNLTNNIVVFSRHDFNFIKEFGNITVPVTREPINCEKNLRFAITASSLSFALFCLIIVCIGLVLHLRKVNKRHRIDNFLLYSLR